MKMLLTITEPSHILYGSDYPYVAAPVLRFFRQRKTPFQMKMNKAIIILALMTIAIPSNAQNNQTETKVQNMNNALTPHRQGLAVIASLEAKGKQPWPMPLTTDLP